METPRVATDGASGPCILLATCSMVKIHSGTISWYQFLRAEYAAMLLEIAILAGKSRLVGESARRFGRCLHCWTGR